MEVSRFRGLGVALVTPFKNDKSIDFPALEKFIDFQVGHGADYMLVLGTTSESATMTEDERVAIIDFIIDINKKRLPIMVGCGGNNTADVIDGINKLNHKDGIDAILSVVPYYNKPNQRGIYQHFKIIAESSKLPVVLYNVPGRTSSNICASTTIKLATDFKNIIGIKEATSDMGQIMQLAKRKPDHFLLLSGDDALTLPLISLGFDGVISVLANAYPVQFSKLVHTALKGDYETARKLQFTLIDIIDSLFEEGNPSGVKAYLEKLGLMGNNLRLPLVPVSDELNKKITGLML